MQWEYPTFLRVAVSTANLLSFDYERKTQVSQRSSKKLTYDQGIWYQDLPKIEKNTDSKKRTREEVEAEELSKIALDFKETLIDYVTQLGLDASFLENYSYAGITVLLVTSVPG